MMPKIAGLRRSGSAATDLAWVASGRYDGYWENGVSAWDTAAGIVLVREAGGIVTDTAGNGDMFATKSVVAGNETIHGAILENIAAARTAA